MVFRTISDKLQQLGHLHNESQFQEKIKALKKYEVADLDSYIIVSPSCQITSIVAYIGICVDSY